MDNKISLFKVCKEIIEGIEIINNEGILSQKDLNICAKKTKQNSTWEKTLKTQDSLNCRWATAKEEKGELADKFRRYLGTNTVQKKILNFSVY